MVHLLHRLYGVDAPDVTKSRHCQRMYGASTVNLLHRELLAAPLTTYSTIKPRRGGGGIAGPSARPLLAAAKSHSASCVVCRSV